MKQLIFLVSIFFVCVFCRDIHAEQIVFTSLEWPPYIGADLPGNGASAQIAKEAFRVVGHTLKINYFPWKRAQLVAEKGGAAGFFPEYYSYELNRKFYISDRMGESPVGFIEPAGKRVVWNVLDDLKGLRIGVVSGYINSAEFDTMVASGELTVDVSVEDSVSIKKVAMGRVDLAVIDKYVFEYLMATDAFLKEFRGKVVFNDKLLTVNGLYLYFLKNENGLRLMKAFNKGLETIDWVSVQDKFMHNVLDGVQ